jgi:hypothetical protein
VIGCVVWIALNKSYTVIVSDDGVTMYGLWKLRWDEVAAARPRTVLGHKYVYITRTGKWWRWWLPLYFVGSRPLAVALARRAPAGNPIGVCVAGVD